jgi:hypothetical protein
MLLIRILIIFICSLYIIRSLIRIFLPVLFKSVINKAQEQQNYQQQYKKPDEKIRVDYVPEGKKSSVPDSEGEFVEYEEIKK